MPNWLAKAIVQKTLSLAPGSRTWNYLLQTHVTHSLDLDRPQGAYATRFAYKLAQCRRHVEHYRIAGEAGAVVGAVETAPATAPSLPTQAPTVAAGPLRAPSGAVSTAAPGHGGCAPATAPSLPTQARTVAAGPLRAPSGAVSTAAAASPEASAAGFTALELGTGWHPIVPIGLYLCGADEVWTLDQQPMLALARLRDVLGRFVRAAAQPDWPTLLPQAQSRRVAALADLLAGPAATPQRMLERLNIHMLIGRAQDSCLPAAAIDLIVSNNTLEHIPHTELAAIFGELRRLATPTAVMSHFVDLADHYVNYDNHLSPYNFLRFSPLAWRCLNNSLQYMNRLRISDYRALHAASGFAITSERSDASAAPLLAGVPLARQFRDHAPADLAVTSSWIVSVPSSAELSHHRVSDIT